MAGDAPFPTYAAVPRVPRQVLYTRATVCTVVAAAVVVRLSLSDMTIARAKAFSSLARVAKRGERPTVPVGPRPLVVMMAPFLFMPRALGTPNATEAGGRSAPVRSSLPPRVKHPGEGATAWCFRTLPCD